MLDYFIYSVIISSTPGAFLIFIYSGSHSVRRWSYNIYSLCHLSFLSSQRRFIWVSSSVIISLLNGPIINYLSYFLCILQVSPVIQFIYCSLHPHGVCSLEVFLTLTTNFSYIFGFQSRSHIFLSRGFLKSFHIYFSKLNCLLNGTVWNHTTSITNYIKDQC